MTSIRVEHKLGKAAALQRFQQLLQQRGIAVTSTGENRGTLEKNVPFAGRVRATFEVLDDAVSVEIVEAPAFPSADTIRRMVSDELQRVLA
jgi:hypothetical protein